MFPPKKEAFWLPIAYALIAGTFGFFAGRSFAKLWLAPADLLDAYGLAFGFMMAILFYAGGLIFWLGIVNRYHIPVYDRQKETEEDAPVEDNGERWVGDAYSKEFFINPVTDLQLYRFAMGIINSLPTTYFQWCQTQDAPFNSESFLALRTWLKERGWAIPIKGGEIEMTESGLAMMTKIVDFGIHLPAEIKEGAGVHSEPFAREEWGRGG